MQPLKRYAVRGTVTYRFKVWADATDLDALDDAIAHAMTAGNFEITAYVDYDANDVELIDVFNDPSEGLE